MANPRKFSEKIALQKQKQAEGTAEFEKIMREVSDATCKQDETNYNQRFDGGIPNKVNNCVTPNVNINRESRGRSVGLGPMRRPSERKNERSPYGSSTTYLSPPNDTYWRRASSDSAIHQSLIQTPEKHHGSHSPISLSPTPQRRPVHVNQNTDSTHFLNNPGSRHLSNVDVRHHSVNPYPSSHDGSLSAPIGNNTGSLPDLTSVHFAPPLNTPLDKEQEHSSSPYSSSPITTSPTALSPTSMPNRYPYSPAHSPSDSNTYSPTHFSSNARQNYLTVPGSHNSTHHFSSKEGQYDNNVYNPSEIGQTTHLSFTNLPGLIHVRNSNISNNNVLHSSHGNLSSIGMAAANITEYRNPQCRPSPGSSPGLIPNIPTSDSNPSAPCSPVPQNPSSSSSSQTYDSYQSQNNDGYNNLNQSFQNHITLVDSTTQDYPPNLQSSQNSYGSIQFDDTAFAQLASLSNATSHHQQQQQQTQPQQHRHQPQQQQQLQQQHQGQHQQQHQQQSPQMQHVNRNNYATQAQEMNTNRNDVNSGTPTNSRYGTNSNLIPQNSQNMTVNDQHNAHHLHNNYQTASTPTSIPEIVFSDFSTANSDFPREIFSSIDLELGQIDVAGMQMLTDPNATMIADPTIEDSFRRDLN